MNTHRRLVENRPGVLNQVASKFSRRGFNIARLTVGHDRGPGASRMTFTVDGAAHDIEQVTKQLYKVIEVVKVVELDDSRTPWRASWRWSRWRTTRRTAAPSSRSSTSSARKSST